MPDFTDNPSVSSEIASIQRGTITIPASTLSATATITAVNVATSVLFHLGQSGIEDHAATMQARLTLTNSTTITATRGNVGGGGNPLLVEYQIVEYN